MKATNSILLERTNDLCTYKSWNVGDDKNAARFLLESCIEFVGSYNAVVIKNPFYGCTSLEKQLL